MTAKIIWDAISGFLRSINAVLSIVPGLVWAILLAIAALYGSLMHHERDSAVSEKNVIQASYEQLTAKVIHQKMEATALLKKLTAERDALQAQVNDMRKAQEKKDADNAKLIATQAARLRDLAAASPGGQLRDPNAGRGCGRAGAESGPAAAAGSGAEHAAEAGGLLSKELSGLLIRLTGEADDINAAYESARADALMCRQAQSASP
jgi:hypothetical protein